MPEADEYFGINEYSDLIVLTKPIIYMTIQEIAETHKILVENLHKIAADDPEDPLRKIFGLLNREPDLDSFGMNFNNNNSSIRQVSSSFGKSDANTGAVAAVAAAVADNKIFNKNTQLCLTLTNRFTPSNDEFTEYNNLFIK